MWFQKKRKRIKKTPRQSTRQYAPEEKLRLIQEFEKMNTPVDMFCKWYGVSGGQFKEWLQRFKTEGEAGLVNRRRKAEEIPEAIREEIIKLKLSKPELGALKIVDFMKRHKFVKLNKIKVSQILREDQRTAVLIAEPPIMRGNSGKEPMRFERSKPRQMFQMDIMTFMLKGLYRVYLIGCLDDYSRFVVSIGLYRKQTTDNVLDVLKAAVERYGMPEEMLTDNGRQFYTWRGRSEFQKYLTKSGIRHIRSRPYHPQTLGKIESLWRNLYQEVLSKVPLNSFEEAKAKIDEWVRWYNYKRPHQGIEGLVPADRFFGVEKAIREVMDKGAGMVQDALVMDPRRIKEPVYLVGKIGGKEIKVIAKEGSVMVEGLEEVETKELPKAEERLAYGVEAATATGAKDGDEVSSTDSDGKETDQLDGGMVREAENSRNLPGNGGEQGSVLPVGTEGSESTGEGVEAATDRATGEEPCARGEAAAGIETASNGIGKA